MNRKSVIIAVLSSVILWGAGGKARTAPGRIASVEPDGKLALAHVQTLASESMAGRKSGTPGYDQAAAYVADKMKEFGLAPGGDGGTYFQRVPLKTWTSFEPPARLEVVSPRRRAFVPGRNRDFTPMPGTGSGIVRAKAAFAGFGVVADSAAWDDYRALEVAGRVVMVMAGAPKVLGAAGPKDWTILRKLKLAVEKGALGLIELNLSEPEKSQEAPRQRPAPLPAGACPDGFIVMQAGRAFADDLFNIEGKSWRDSVSKTLRLGRPFPLALEAEVELEAHYASGERSAANVLGVIPGSDRRLRGEVVIVGGHLDHLGVGLDGFVYPGADDNACSAAVLLETARVLQASRFRPRRTIVFASWAGEELGLHGSRYYVEHPLFPLERTAAYLNIDMVGLGDEDLFVGGMWEYGRFYEIIRRGLDDGLRAKLHSRRSYRGSDHVSFWNRGVTAVSLRTGELLTRGLDDEHPEYHLPGDRPELIDPGLLALAARYHVQALKSLSTVKDDLLDKDFRTEFLHKDSEVVDLHCDTIGRFLRGEDLRLDLPRGHIDIPKLKRGAVDLQVFACFTGAPASSEEKHRDVRETIRQIDGLKRLAAENPDDLALVLSPEDFQALRGTGRSGVLIGVEGGYTITDDLSLLRTYHDLGVRLLTLTHWTHTDWADASGDPVPVFNGLTDFGKALVKEMNGLGMIIDLSHASDKTFQDVLALTQAPVVASHSCCRALADHHRNLTDDMLKALAKNNGLVGINFSAGFLDAGREAKVGALQAEVTAKYGLPSDYREFMRSAPEKRDPALKEFQARRKALLETLPPVNVKTLADHIDHVVKVTGNANHVGLGSDFDGISETPAGLENAGLLENITRELRARNYKEEDIRKILGGNFLRVWNMVRSKGRTGAASGGERSE